MRVSPTSRVAAGISPRASGARLGTVAVKYCVAVRPPGSVAVTAMVAAPRATAVTVTVFPAAATVATPVSEAAAEYARLSPSGSPKYGVMSSETVSPASMVSAGIWPRDSGARLATVAWKDCVAVRPPGSVAVTAMVAAARARASRVIAPPVAATSNTPACEAVAA